MDNSTPINQNKIGIGNNKRVCDMEQSPLRTININKGTLIISLNTFVYERLFVVYYVLTFLKFL